MQIWPGAAYPLGATWDGSGTNFALFSEVAERVQLCLFGTDGAETRLDLTEVDGFVWHCYLPAVGPGQRYAYRVTGPYDPRRGQRCNPAKLLLDPYGKAVDGSLRWDAALFDYQPDDPAQRNDADSAPFMPRNVVINPYFDWTSDRQPRTPYHQTVIYEAHVRGLTMRHPQVPPELRGTYSGLASPPVIEHLTRLGVTAIELMPVHQSVPEHKLAERGLTNYWGYNTIGFLAPHNAYSSSAEPHGHVAEFKSMVKALHEAGIEVILDVVYNHTAESGGLGPTLSFRGIDNAAYYRLDDSDPSVYLDYTGCGNSLNVMHPHALQLIMDSLRYWILDMHVDGFRFDLAAALARELHEVDRLSAFFELVQQDPVVSQVKLIAEPWDVGAGRVPGRQVPAAMDRVERQVPRHRQGLLAGPAGRAAGVRLPAERVERPVRDQRPPPGRVDQLRHLPRRFHPRRPGQLQPASTTRRTAITTLTGRTTTGPGTAGPKARPTTPRSPSCARARCGTSWSRCSARKACRCCWPATN